MKYRRTDVAGGTYFFTVNLADRRSDLLVRRITDLRVAIANVKKDHPFEIVAMVVLPEHIHAIWRLPLRDTAYAKRWSLIKSGFSKRQASGEKIGTSRRGKRERGIWQRRYWEHQIRDEHDLARCVDYIHYNPVKHGWAEHPIEWPYSTIHKYIKRGGLPRDWGGRCQKTNIGHPKKKR